MSQLSHLIAPVLLASASPRRRELLKLILTDFDVTSADIDETPMQNEKPECLVERLAKSKAKVIAEQYQTHIVIGSDTIVVANDTILGKPKSFKHFSSMMSLLSGKEHTVLTALCVVHQAHEKTCIVRTQVEMADLTEHDILDYWQTGEPTDKAGGYAIQGIGGQFVKRIEGSHSSVIGLPLYETKTLLADYKTVC